MKVNSGKYYILLLFLIQDDEVEDVFFKVIKKTELVRDCSYRVLCYRVLCSCFAGLPWLVLTKSLSSQDVI